MEKYVLGMGQREMLYIKSLNRNTTEVGILKKITFYKYNKINCQNNQSHLLNALKMQLEEI